MMGGVSRAHHQPRHCFRILDEERAQENELAGHKEYKQKVKYRLIPFVWYSKKVTVTSKVTVTKIFTPANNSIPSRSCRASSFARTYHDYPESRSPSTC